ncbi:MAG: multicopper oxidase family protein [Gemmatimonadetes bacterium]|nr:multicopper oxidase family protein [Gemmatimonadota bacterium]
MHPAAPMPAGLHRDPPDVAPYLPLADPAGLSEARPTRIVRLSDGDSLDLVAGPVRRTIGGRVLTLYGFNGQIPGPLIRVDQGATITVGFTNRTGLPSAIHWHGIRLDNAFDGVPHVTQEPVEPGGTFRYEIHFPDAGLYWYHPHHREDILQDLGLYGNLQVDASDAGYWNPVSREEYLVLDDILIGEEGLIPYGEEAATHALMGRFGNVLLVNGEPEYRLEIDRNEIVRFFLTNVSATRTFNVSFGEAPIKLVASDAGRFEREEWVASVAIAPAERYIVEVLFDTPGEVALTNRVRAIDHLNGRFFPEIDTLGVVAVAAGETSRERAEAFSRLGVNEAVSAEIDRYRSHFERPPDRELVLTVEADSLPFPLGMLLRLDRAYFNPVEWSGTMPVMNWATTGRQVRWILRDPATGKENQEIDWRFRPGDVVKLRLTNSADALHAMQHPIHLHGQRFLVLSQGGVANDNLVWKDTLLVPAGEAADILLDLSNPGRWMLHCHIAEHLEAGMQTIITVEPE